MRWRTLGRLLEEQAHQRGDKEFVHFLDSGERLTYAAFNDRCDRFAAGLAKQGVSKGDVVALMLRNSIEYLVAAYALKKLGAVEVSLNIDFRGRALVRTVNLTQSDLLITANEFLEPLNRIVSQLVHLKRLIMVDEATMPLPGRDHLSFDEVLSTDQRCPSTATDDMALAAVLFTSGTTGFSKGLEVTHRYLLANAAMVAETFGLTESDCVYTPWPLHHYGAAACEVGAAMFTGGRVALRSRLSVSRFWPEVRSTESTWAMMMGGSQKWLWDQPSSGDDRDHGLRFLWGGPFPVDRSAFEARFGLQTAYCYGLSDIGNPCIEKLDADEPPNSCGRVKADWYDLRAVDENDNEVATGEAGEIVCREKVPGLILRGYYGQPDLTAEAFANGWLHTGDLGRFDERGHLFFLDRKKQVLRHNGENILPAEVEEVIGSHPAVRDCAVVGVPNEVKEQDIAVFIVPRDNAVLDPESLRDYCRGELAEFMIPSIIRVVDVMPMTSTEKPALGKLLELLD